MTDADPSPAAPRPLGWRILFWLFAALGVASAAAIIWLVVMMNAQWRGREPAVVAGKAAGTAFVVRSVAPLAGTSLIAIEIEASSERPGSGSLKPGGDDLRNILLLDRRSGQSRRLLPDNGTRIAERLYLPAAAQQESERQYEAAQGRDERQPPAYYALLLERGLEGTKRYDLMVGILGGGEQGIVMQGLDGVHETSMIDARRVGMVVRERGRLSYRIVDIPTRKLLETHPIAID